MACPTRPDWTFQGKGKERPEMDDVPFSFPPPSPFFLRFLTSPRSPGTGAAGDGPLCTRETGNRALGRFPFLFRWPPLWICSVFRLRREQRVRTPSLLKKEKKCTAPPALPLSFPFPPFPPPPPPLHPGGLLLAADARPGQARPFHRPGRPAEAGRWPPPSLPSFFFSPFPPSPWLLP